MQFKGSVRAPGDKDPGVRVVLEIDEYHLEIRRDSELIGRYYLADVEVARDIAERFILFLGEDEVEFLADDALQFAYGGVTAMQDGWLAAQKRKRRHRRAAEEAARRKDGERPLETESPVARPVYVSDSDTIRNRRRQVAGKSPEPAAPERAVIFENPAPIPQTPSRKRADRTPRKEVAAANALPPVEVAEAVASPAPEVTVAPGRVGRGSATSAPAAAEPAAAPRRRPKGAKDPVPIAVGQADSSPPDDAPIPEASRTPAAAETVLAEVEPELPVDLSLADRRRKITADAKPTRPDDLGRVRVPEPVPGAAVRESRSAASTSPVEPARANTPVETDEVRFAQEGHHPAETSTGLLAKLRRQPKLPTNHVHKFKEAGSSVGLVRRVCIECAHVSIGSEDN